ncbi:unnamed protein product [Brassicogethes aeneus]|uniref:Hexosyltransferase n=1 Tax=Brassicogethes aeneus TaxID=1431903 RepID=A0A9P0BAS6_BRAAE|nr:unnamed protein product [Brassicogethes aeneus]
MRKFTGFRNFKIYLIGIFSFLLGCMITINLTPIDKTCRIENTDREHNMMKNSKLKDPELVVVILSAPKSAKRRLVLRETWLNLRSSQNVDFKIKHFFAVGDLGLSKSAKKDLIKEQKKYNDVLILPLYDSYSNLTEKVAKTFHWLNDQYDYGLAYKFVLKCDDDSFVRLDTLSDEIINVENTYLKLKELNGVSDYIRVNLQSNTFDKNSNLSLYWGYFNGNAKIKSTGKWKENNWIFCDRYLPYAVGGGYVLSKDLITYVAKNIEYLRFYNSEDISVGLWFSSINNILRIHDVRFDTEWASRGCLNQHIVTHNISERDMKMMYETIINENQMCSSDSPKRNSYFYNWTAPPSQCCTKLV